MATGRQRFARQQVERNISDGPPGEVATITTVTAGGGTDGNALVTVTHNGTTGLKYPYLLQYTPVVGHVVAIHPWGGTYLILGRPGGFPPTP